MRDIWKGKLAPFAILKPGMSTELLFPATHVSVIPSLLTVPSGFLMIELVKTEYFTPGIMANLESSSSMSSTVLNFVPLFKSHSLSLHKWSIQKHLKKRENCPPPPSRRATPFSLFLDTPHKPLHSLVIRFLLWLLIIQSTGLLNNECKNCYVVGKCAWTLPGLWKILWK